MILYDILLLYFITTFSRKNNHFQRNLKMNISIYLIDDFEREENRNFRIFKSGIRLERK